jgi:SAM-dependent methyltransferase
MAGRSFESHGRFFADHLKPGHSVLDCGCGPGTITMGLAARVFPGQVIGVDLGETQIASAAATGRQNAVQNATFQVADCHSLPFADRGFDRVFSHALVEHLPDPVRMLKELHRVLKPGGLAGICSPDWGGFVLAPPSAALDSAVSSYISLQVSNGGDVRVGRKLGLHLSSAGFQHIELSARYECLAPLGSIAEYLAIQLERDGDSESATTFRGWSQDTAGLFALCWISAIGRKAGT